MRIDRVAAGLAAVCLIALVGMLFLDGPAGAKRVRSLVRAKTIELVDRNGQVRAQLALERNGEVVFRMRDQDGDIKLKLGAGRSGSGLLLLDENTEPGVQALAGEETSVAVQRGEERNVVVP